MERKINPNSLANLQKPKPKKDYGYRYALPQEKVDDLFRLLTEDNSLRKAAKGVDICYDTAKKYFERGDPRRGIQPLQIRLKQFQETLTVEFDKKLIERRTYFLEIINTAIEQIKEQIDAKVLVEKASYNQLGNLMKLDMFLRGGVVIKRERKEGTIDTAEDIRDLATG